LHLIQPFAGLRPAPAYAAAVAAPPYDVLSTDEARVRAAGKPWSFLHISRPEIDLPAGTDPHALRVYAKAAENLQRMLREGVLVRDPQPCYYAYRLSMGEQIQTGLAVAASLADYESNRIRRHELTRPDKEDDRVRQIEAVDAQTGPVLLAYPQAARVDALLQQATLQPAASNVEADDGVRHTIWTLGEPELIAELTAAFDAMPALYIADGHHRCAAAARVAAARRRDAPRHSGAERYNTFLAVAFPHHQLRILDYNRVVKDLKGLGLLEFQMRIGKHFSIRASDTAVRPTRHGEFGLYLPKHWYRLEIKPELAQPADPVKRLDVSLLQDYLLAPVLGIEDPRTDKRIDFVGGVRGLSELERRVDCGAAAAAFSLCPTRMEDLMAVADAGLVMPPKSTWFEPKLADGLVSQVLAG
jgi:uncharacterized protein (DUF1015 family)